MTDRILREGGDVRIHEMPKTYQVKCSDHGQLAVGLSWREALVEQDRHIRIDHLTAEWGDSEVSE